MKYFFAKSRISENIWNTSFTSVRTFSQNGMLTGCCQLYQFVGGNGHVFTLPTPYEAKTMMKSFTIVNNGTAPLALSQPIKVDVGTTINTLSNQYPMNVIEIYSDGENWIALSTVPLPVTIQNDNIYTTDGEIPDNVNRVVEIGEGAKLQFLSETETAFLSIIENNVSIGTGDTYLNFSPQGGKWQGKPLNYLYDNSADYTDRSLIDLGFLNGVLGNYVSASQLEDYYPYPTGGSNQYIRGDGSINILDTDQVIENGNKYFTSTRARQSIGITTNNNSGAATYNVSTGVFNIPVYTLGGLGGEPAISPGTSQDYWRGDKTWAVLNTDSVTEGTAKYYTDSRARQAISLTTNGSGAATYNSGTGILNIPTFNGTGFEPAISSSSTDKYWRGDKTFQVLDTSVVPENNSLYFTQARARQSISLSTIGNNGSATYNNSTGLLVIPTYTLSGLGGEPSIALGTTSQYWRGDKSWQALDTSVVTENGNLYYTDARARGAISLTTTGTGAATYDNITGALNVPAPSNTGASGYYQNGGNSFGSNATIGTNDNFSLGIKANNIQSATISNTDGSWVFSQMVNVHQPATTITKQTTGIVNISQGQANTTWLALTSHSSTGSLVGKITFEDTSASTNHVLPLMRMTANGSSGVATIIGESSIINNDGGLKLVGQTTTPALIGANQYVFGFYNYTTLVGQVFGSSNNWSFGASTTDSGAKVQVSGTGSTTAGVVHVIATTNTADKFLLSATSTEGGSIGFKDSISSGFYPTLEMVSSGANAYGGYILSKLPTANDIATSGRAVITLEGRLTPDAAIVNSSLFMLKNYTTTVATVTAGGNLLLGTNTDNARLTVAGASATTGNIVSFVNSSGTNGLQISNSGVITIATPATYSTGGNGLLVHNTTTNNIEKSTIQDSNIVLQNGNSFGTTMSIGTNDAQILALRTGGTNKITINSAGTIFNFADTTVAGQTYTFNSSGSGSSKFRAVDTVGASDFLLWNRNQTFLQGTTVYFRNADGSTEYGRFTSTGSLLIGNTAGTARLAVWGNSTTTGNAISVSDSGGTVNSLTIPNAVASPITTEKDIEITNAAKGIILKDAGDGTRRRITVVNGVLTVSAPL